MKNAKIYRLQPEPRNRDLHIDCQARLVEYDDRMREEERKYSRLLAELKNNHWHARSIRQNHDEFSDFEENGYRRIADADIDRAINEMISAELESTRLTEDELRYRCDLTLEEVLQKQELLSVLKAQKCLDISSTQQSISFQRTLSLEGGNINSSSLIGMRGTLVFDDRESIAYDSEIVKCGKVTLSYGEEARSFIFPTYNNRNGVEYETMHDLYPETVH